MSEAVSSVHLSEFFNDDDSEGHRFVDFIKKRRGRSRKQKFLFMDCETDRMNLEVQLEKLPTPQFKKVDATSSKLRSNCASTGQQINKDKNGNALNELPSKSLAAGKCDVFTTLDFLPNTASAAQQSDGTNTRSIRSKRSTTRESRGVVSTCDNLRRFSIKNNSVGKLAGGRQTLLQEFENTIEGSDFNPPICSTPLSQPTANAPQLPITETQNIQLIKSNNPISSETYCMHTDSLIRTLQNKDDELKGRMESISDKTLEKIEHQSKILEKNSTGKRTANKRKNCTPLKKPTLIYDKGNVSGQLVLTSSRINDKNSTTSTLHQLPNQINDARTNFSTCQHSYQKCKLAGHKSVRQDPSILSEGGVSETLQTNYANKAVDLENTQKDKIETRNTPHNNNFPESEENMTDNTILICSAKDGTVVVIPLSKTTSEITSPEKNNYLSTQNTQNNNCSPVVQRFHQAEDNLKLTDILTDDEENTPESTLENLKASEIPLNLATRSSCLRKKHQRKDTSSKETLSKENVQNITSEMEIDISTPAHSTRQRKYKYSKDLAHWNNSEILDLRKRNSKGQIFVEMPRRSNRNKQNEPELLKLKPNNIVQDPICQENEIEQTVLQDMSFIGENPSDRVKFKSNKSNSQPDKRKIPEILMQYLEVSKRYSNRKQRKCRGNMSKRSLFSAQNLDGSAEQDSLMEKSKKGSVSCLKSPPNTNNDLVATPKAVSQPPAITASGEVQNRRIKLHKDVNVISSTTGEIKHTRHADIVAVKTTGEKRNTRKKIYADSDKNITLIPPPPGFESDSLNTNQHTPSVTHEVRGSNESVNAKLNTNNNDNLFKRPINSVSKRKVKKIGRKSAVDNESSFHNSADFAERHSLSISKPALVPVSESPICTTLSEQEVGKPERYEETKTLNSANSKNSKRIKNALSTNPENIQNDLGATPKIVSPQRTITTTGEMRHTPNRIYRRTDENLTPPPGFENDLNDANQYSGSVTLEVRNPNESVNTNLNANKDDHLFKKPLNPVSKRKAKKIPKTLTAPKESAVGNQISIHSSADLTEGSSLRRSKRGQVPICQPAILTVLYQQEIGRQERYKERKRKDMEKKREEKKLNKTKTLKAATNKKSKRTENSHSTVPGGDDALSDCGSRHTRLMKRAKSSKNEQRNNVTRNPNQNLSSNENVQCSRLILNSPMPVEHLNNMFDQLKQNSLISNATMTVTKPSINIKPLKIRVRRLKSFETAPSIDSTSVSSTYSTSSNTNSNIELVSWLKSMSKTSCTVQQTTTEAFRDMRISSATNLQFTELQGLEYAFYDTVDRACLGYLRFKPRQLKPKKKAKRYVLHFINLMGLFRIAVNNGERLLAVGDMVAIEKLTYYDIQNLTDDVGILMVIKK